MIVHLGNRGNARGSILKRILDVCRLRVAALHAEQSNDGCEAVLNAVAHLARQHGLVIESLLKVRVGMLALDGDAKQPREAGKEFRIRNIELPGVRTVDFKDTKRQSTFATPRDQNVDCALYAVIRQKFWRTKAGFLMKMIGNDRSSSLERVASRGFQVDRKRHLANRPWRPADAGAHQQPFVVGGILQDFGERGFEALGTKLGGPLQDLSDVAGLQRGTAELAQQGLLPQAVRKLLPGDIGRCGRDRYRLLPWRGGHNIVSVKLGVRPRHPTT